MPVDLDKLHNVLLEITDEFARICDKFGLSYFLVGGTLLGAVRHKGFIPWDDDVDISMPRKDYEKFIDVCRDELSHEYFLQCNKTAKDWWKPFIRIRKNHTITVLEEYLYKPLPHDHYGIFIDIFPLDNARSANGLTQKAQRFCIKKIISMIEYKRGYRPKNILKRLSLVLSLLFTYHCLHTLILRVMTFNKNDKSRYYVNLVGVYSCYKETIAKDVFFPSTKLEFEGRLYQAPGNWDSFLRHVYGDYITPPPQTERKNKKHFVKVIFDTREESVDFEAEIKGRLVRGLSDKKEALQ
jgi:lipopolysaccharide cholinephosphotransferase